MPRAHPPPHPASGAAANHSPPEVTSGDRDAEGKKQQSLEENVTSSKQRSTWKGSLKDVPWLRSTLVPLWGFFYFHPHRPPPLRPAFRLARMRIQGLAGAGVVFHRCLRRSRLERLAARVGCSYSKRSHRGGCSDWRSCLTPNTTMTQGGRQLVSKQGGEVPECVCV